MLFMYSLFMSSLCIGRKEAEIPIILIHGLVKNKNDMNIIKTQIHKNFPEKQVDSIEISFAEFSTIFHRPEDYVLKAALAIRDAIDKMHQEMCIDIIAHSQGGFIARTYIQIYSQQNGFPAVRRLYTLSGVMAGYYCHHQCGIIKKTSPLIKLVQTITHPMIVYSKFISWAILPSMMWKDPIHPDKYLGSNSLLCRLNGECGQLQGMKLADLELLVTFWSPNDAIISPAESSKFWFFKPGCNTIVQDVKETELYKSDKFGLRIISESGRWVVIRMDGYGHRDYVKGKAIEFFDKCLRPLIGGQAMGFSLADCGEVE